MYNTNSVKYIDKLHILALCKETVSLRCIFYGIFSMSPNRNGQFGPYIGKYEQDLQERRENLVSLNTRVSKYRIENSISDKPPLYWTYIRKGTVSQYIQVTRCIAKTLHTYAYTQPSLILMFPSFYILTLLMFRPNSLEKVRENNPS